MSVYTPISALSLRFADEVIESREEKGCNGICVLTALRVGEYRKEYLPSYFFISFFTFTSSDTLLLFLLCKLAEKSPEKDGLKEKAATLMFLRKVSCDGI